MLSYHQFFVVLYNKPVFRKTAQALAAQGIYTASNVR